MSENLERRLSALEAELKQLRSKRPPPQKSGEEYICGLEDSIGKPTRNAIDAQRDRGARVREAKEQARAVAAIKKAGGSPESYTIQDLHRACRELDWNSMYFEGQLKSFLKRQAEEAEGSKKAE